VVSWGSAYRTRKKMTYELANRIVTTVLMNEGLARYFHEHDIKVTYAEYNMTAT
jgi:spore cortex formation protein SpoVR/YcgB (stage V sporulation)